MAVKCCIEQLTISYIIGDGMGTAVAEKLKTLPAHNNPPVAHHWRRYGVQMKEILQSG